MSALVSYAVHRQANRPLEFRGLVGRYIFYAGALAVLSLLLCASLFVTGLSSWICLPLCLGGGICGILRLYVLSKRYGEKGWRKLMLARRNPSGVRYSSRRPFFIPLIQSYNQAHAKNTSRFYPPARGSEGGDADQIWR